ncbi:hypothetical protein [Ammoniphilus oxalaticus]|nr:hypothetical protein [Ammoniphilus oxalaticus]
MKDACVHCGEDLSVIEKSRSECFECRDKISLTASEEDRGAS